MPLSISSYINQVVAGQPRKPSPIHDALQAIANWASAGLVDSDIAAGAAIARSKLAAATATHCFPLPITAGYGVSGATAATLITHPAASQVSALHFAEGSATSGLQWAFQLPPDYVADSNVTLVVKFTTTSTAAGNIRFRVLWQSWTTTENLNANPTGSTVLVAANDTAAAYRVQSASLTLTGATNGLGTAGEYVSALLLRDDANAADTFTGHVDVVSIEVQYTATV